MSNSPNIRWLKFNALARFLIMNSKKNSLFVRSDTRTVINNNNNLNNNEPDLQICDLDDYEDNDPINEWKSPDLNKKFMNRLEKETKPIDIDTAVALKRIFVGSSTSSIGIEWLEQNFDFENQNPQLWYGLIQYKGGPCGILAAVQAYLCAEFFHYDQHFESLNETDLNQYRNKCLSNAIGNILWQIATNNKKHVIVALNGHRPIIEERKDFSFDRITERLRICEFTSKADMFDFLDEMFQYSNHIMGCVPFVYSCILTRGVDDIQNDYDNGSINALLTKETFLCSQELVNLCLVGRAVSNVFDSNIQCGDNFILQGITKQSLIGFLTLHEYDGGAKVGTCYKSPKLPIYVILSESHFSVLFSKDKIIGQQFNLFYYCGLMRQNKEIMLTIETNESMGHESIDQDLKPLECVIKTKWPNCKIIWKEPIF